MGVAAGGDFGNMANQMFAPMHQQPQQQSTPQPSGRFTQKSTETPPIPTSSTSDDPVASLKKLKEMLDLGLIEQSEFNDKKSEIMSRM